MKVSRQGLELLESFEGCKLKAYKCPAGVWTIGVGSTHYSNGSKVLPNDVLISKEAALELLADTLKNFEETVARHVKVIITQHEFDALVSLCYNIGPTNFNSSTLLKLLNAGEPAEVVVKQFVRWNKAGGKVLAGLTRRRQAEARLFLTGSLVT
jgi:lysozyme